MIKLITYSLSLWTRPPVPLEESSLRQLTSNFKAADIDGNKLMSRYIGTLANRAQYNSNAYDDNGREEIIDNQATNTFFLVRKWQWRSPVRLSSTSWEQWGATSRSTTICLKKRLQSEDFDLDELKLEGNIFILQVFFALDRGKKNGQVMR